MSPRDRWICAVLPALTLLIIYVIAVARPAGRRIAALRSELAAADPVEVSAHRLRQAQAEGARLETDLRLLKEQDAASPALPDAPEGDVSTRRMATLRDVSRLCESAGLTLLGSTPAEGTQSAQPPAAMLERFGKAGWPDLTAWRLDLRGGYGAMVRLLDSIAASDLRVLPAGIAMEPAPGEARPIEWVLNVWL